jgi:hypothetical protein
MNKIGNFLHDQITNKPIVFKAWIVYYPDEIRYTH